LNPLPVEGNLRRGIACAREQAQAGMADLENRGIKLRAGPRHIGWMRAYCCTWHDYVNPRSIPFLHARR
jgi:hypothetical protein